MPTPPSAHVLARRLTDALVDGRVALAATDPRQRYDLFHLEHAAVRHAVPKRVNEFSAGRAAARCALSELGVPETEIPMDSDRSPIWPLGTRGSITHSSDICLAAVAWDSDIRLLGLDVEPDLPLGSDLVPMVCTDAERAWLDTHAMPNRYAKLIFSAKESVYKAQYPYSRTLFGFETLDVELDLARDRFSAIFREEIPGFPLGTKIAGRFLIGHGLIVTAVVEPI
ncbi:4'-phosphopantetheinyl transferase [Thiorhodococcus drewsii AZ1]|uniref:Enterobactin synthase component D n=1 Tax=Thiorhodococcus drewsii AZ1 TaxID=765913 RepID=G2E6C8_9GAMM|nr:4'-phosphopantetheinyl transferase [Thiorhodococcus drewsii AZ1]